jgi:hypothetical protein
MEYIPAINAVTPGARFSARVTSVVSIGVWLAVDFHRFARRNAPLPDTFLFFEKTVAPDEARRLKVADEFEVAILEVHREADMLVASLPAEPAWLAWNKETVRHLARRIRATGETVLLPVLADALEEAGCTDAAMLDHCRFSLPDTPDWLVELLATQE